MRAGLISVLLVVGCGGSSKPAPTPPKNPTTDAGSGSGSASTPVAGGPATDEQACGRMLELKKQSCGSFAGLPFSDVKQCVGELQKAADDPLVKTFVGCVMQPSCEEVKNCIQAAS